MRIDVNIVRVADPALSHVFYYTTVLEHGRTLGLGPVGKPIAMSMEEARAIGDARACETFTRLAQGQACH